MNPRRLGQTDLIVSPIGLGCWQFSQGRGYSKAVWAVIDQTTIDAIVAAALDGGITWFDTAEAYGNGQSELALSTALHRLGVHPSRIVVADKWLPLGRTAASITRTIDTRLQHLQGYPIGLYQIHQPWSFSPVRVQMREMAKLVREGKIAAAGVSNFSAAQMIKASEALRDEGLTLAANQVPISLLDRRVEHNGVLAAARRLGITLIAYSPLAQGLLTGKYHDNPTLASSLPAWRRIRRTRSGRTYGPENLRRTRPLIEELRVVGAAHGFSVSQVALAWLIQFYGDTVVAIPGATRVEQARESAAAMSLRLTDDELARIDRASAPLART